jgi:hypothetical protein
LECGALSAAFVFYRDRKNKRGVKALQTEIGANQSRFTFGCQGGKNKSGGQSAALQKMAKENLLGVGGWDRAEMTMPTSLICGREYSFFPTALRQITSKRSQ